MPDISMCHGEGCDKKDTCYRYTAIPSQYWQSFMKPDPKDCKNYWDDKEYRENKMTKDTREIDEGHRDN